MSLRATIGIVAISSLKVGLMNQTPTAFFMGLQGICNPDFSIKQLWDKAHN